jgi:hypothetical protein
VYRLLCFQIIIVSLLISGGILSCAKCKNPPLETGSVLADNPANASYYLENEWIQLANGRAEWPASPDSASKIEVALLGETIYGDINRDGTDDAVVFLTYNGGGSGTFFYIAAALFKNEQYLGTNGIWFGDRIRSPTAKIKNGLISINYLDRSHDESMATAPSVEQTRYFILDHSTLREIKTAADETVRQGWLIVGHEVRSFLPCDENDELWLAGDSPALAEIIDSYRETMTGFPPYAPTFVVLAGKKTAPPGEGFAAEYGKAFSASEFIHIWPKGNCRSNLISLDSPLPGVIIASPLTITGWARGTWFFEGDFPIILEDGQGKNIAVSYATAQGEWMTTDFVEFKGVLEFINSSSGQRGTLILKKDNPTGQIKFDDALRIPVNFK